MVGCVQSYVFSCHIKLKRQFSKNKSKLRGTTIFIEEDFSNTVHKERMKLQPYLVEARTRDNFAYLRYKYLYIDRERLSLFELQASFSRERYEQPMHN